MINLICKKIYTRYIIIALYLVLMTAFDAFSKERLLIPVMPGSCLSCTFKAEQVNQLDPSSSIFYFLFPEDFSEELDYIIDIYKLNEYPKDHFLFSDSLFKKYYRAGQVDLIRENTESKTFTRVEFSKINEIKDTRDLGSHEDTINIPSSSIPKSSGQIVVSDNHVLYIFNRVRQDIIGMVDLKEKSLEYLTLTDSIIKINFLNAFSGDLTEYTQMKNVKLLGKNYFTYGQPYGDTFYATSSHTYIGGITDNGDTIARSFVAMNLFVKGKYIKSYAVDHIALDSCFFIKPNFHFYNNKLYTSLLKVEATCKSPVTQKYFLGEFELVGNRFVFTKVMSFVLPDINYDVGYRLINCIFDKQYFITALSNNLYDINSQTFSKMSIPHNVKFETRAVFEDVEGTIFNMRHFCVKGDLVYMIILDRTKKEYRLLKYNFRKSRLERNIVLPNCYISPILDIVDPEFVFFPVDDERIVRKKIL